MLVVHRVVVVAVVVAAVLCGAACSLGGPPQGLKLGGKHFKRGPLAYDGTHASWLYSIPDEGVEQRSRVGIIASTSESAVALHTWITSEYDRQMKFQPNVPMTREVNERDACKTGIEGGARGLRPFVGLMLCDDLVVDGAKVGACIELDDMISEALARQGKDTCAKWRADHRDELAGLLPLLVKDFGDKTLVKP